MTTIRLLDARRGLNRKCEELFRDARIAELIYRFLCDGIEECEDAEPERKKGKWIEDGYWSEGVGMGELYGNYFKCSVCEGRVRSGYQHCYMNFCPNCGSYNGEESDNG